MLCGFICLKGFLDNYFIIIFLDNYFVHLRQFGKLEKLKRENLATLAYDISVHTLKTFSESTPLGGVYEYKNNIIL